MSQAEIIMDVGILIIILWLIWPQKGWKKEDYIPSRGVLYAVLVLLVSFVLLSIMPSPLK